MKNFITGLFVALALMIAGAQTAQAAYEQIYVSGSLNSQGWKPGPSAVVLSSIEDGWFKLEVTTIGEFKVSSTVGSSDSDWTTFNDGAVCFSISTINTTAAGTSSTDNSSVPDATKVIYFSSDLKKAAASDGTWVPDAYKDSSSYSPTGTLPVLHINIYQTDDNGDFILDGDGNMQFDNYQLQVEEIDKEYRKGFYWLDMNGCTTVSGSDVGSADEPLALEMKGRGNWTLRGFAKKPYKLKLGKKQKLLDMGKKSKHWTILAHADDGYGFMRNFSGFNLGQRIGLPWTPSQQPIEVIINEQYRGLYFLTESIRVGDGRVDIEELDDLATDPALISGGYIVELDNYEDDNQISMDEKYCVSGHKIDQLRITYDTPEEYSDVQKRFVTEQFSAMNDYVGVANTADGDSLWAYLDLDDAARYYIVMEILSHVESYHGSTYLFRDRGEGQKWHFSPIWDLGNAFNGSYTDYLYNCDPYGNTWIPSIAVNTKFQDKVKETWKWFMSTQYDGFMDDIDTYCSTIASAAVADHELWVNADIPTGGMAVCDNSDIDARKAAVKNAINTKLAWLASQWGEYTIGDTVDEPERDDTPAAPLPDYATSGIEDVTVGDSTTAPAGYYNLQGIRVSNPTPGAIYIRLQGNTAKKVIF